MYVSTLTGPKCKSLKGYVGPKLIARRLLVVASRVGRYLHLPNLCSKGNIHHIPSLQLNDHFTD